MQKPSYDPGLTTKFDAPLSRAINKDGSFNVHRLGVSWRAFHPWVYLVSIGWPGFLALVLTVYLGINTFFACLYYSMSDDAIQGSAYSSKWGRFLTDFYFSGHTLTTVGYGSLAPRSNAANLMAILEALVGLLAFAIITGLLVARASRPSARIGYSDKALISPYQDRTALMFRIANERSNVLMELEAQVMLMSVTKSTGTPERKFDLLSLERNTVLLFPLTWTVVHPIDENSPLFGKSAEELATLQAEVMILVKGFDETFSQVVHSRYSYRFDEIVWDAKFIPAFRVGPGGDLVLDVGKLGDFVRN